MITAQRCVVYKYVVVLAIAVIAAGLLAVSAVPDQFADAGPRKKIHFTQTVDSAADPGQGRGTNQMALILAPNSGTIYDGSMTFASSVPVRAAILHEIGPDDSRGQPTWTVDGKTTYGLSLVGSPARAGTVEFTGAALALHSEQSEFVATVSVDGWIRGKLTEVILQQVEPQREEPFVSTYRANVAAVIPMHGGLYGGEQVLYAITDSADEEFAGEITGMRGWQVVHAPGIADVPEGAIQDIYLFANGVKGDGLYGYQAEVFSATPEDGPYSGLGNVIKVEWKKGQRASVLESASDVMEAKEAGRVEFDDAGIVVNAPQIVWPGGQMAVRADGTITDEMEYDGGQVTSIDREGMKVTFVAHRGWGPDGQTTYQIVAGAFPSGTADMMGVPYLSAAEMLADDGTADLVRFQNGLRGPGALGFQPGIAGVAGADYTPMWRVHVAEWNDSSASKMLETTQDVESAKDEGLLTVSAARPMNSAHIINSPAIDPFQDS